MSFFDWVPVIISFLALIIPGYWTYRQAIKAKTIETTSSPYGELSKRVVLLESAAKENHQVITDQGRRIRCLEDSQYEDRRFIRRMLQWLAINHPDADHPRPPSWYTQSYPEQFGVDYIDTDSYGSE